MSAPTKPLDNMTKHLTAAEIAARQEAENAVLPDRPDVQLKPPPYLRKDKAAGKYWRQTLKRMEGLALLDVLDTDTLAIYCTMLSRRDSLSTLCRSVLDQAEGEDLATEDRLELAGQADSLNGKLQGLERSLLQYAAALGLTPEGRVRLARKRAAAAAALEPDGDLFGD